MFVPDDDLFNKLIRAVAEQQDNMDQLFARLNDFTPPKPEWLKEEEAKKALEEAKTTWNYFETKI